MNDNDLISRAAAIDAAIDGADDWDGGYSPERERHIRERMAKVPAVDAVPVAWLKTQINEALDDNETELASDIDWLIRRYIDEQEAR